MCKSIILDWTFVQTIKNSLHFIFFHNFYLVPMENESIGEEIFKWNIKSHQNMHKVPQSWDVKIHFYEAFNFTCLFFSHILVWQSQSVSVLEEFVHVWERHIFLRQSLVGSIFLRHHIYPSYPRGVWAVNHIGGGLNQLVCCSCYIMRVLWTAEYKWWDIHKCRVAHYQKIHYVQAWTQV